MTLQERIQEIETEYYLQKMAELAIEEAHQCLLAAKPVESIEIFELTGEEWADMEAETMLINRFEEKTVKLGLSEDGADGEDFAENAAETLLDQRYAEKTVTK